MSSFTSKTGLTPSPTKKRRNFVKTETIQLVAIARTATMTPKHFSNLYNPFPNSCSLLCNHPTDFEARSILKKLKECHSKLEPIIQENLLEKLEELDLHSQNGSLPEELFRKYTETDSRPLTPAPTLASSCTRRCFTPDPKTDKIVKPLLVVDLRRSHSQENLSVTTSSLEPAPPPPQILVETCDEEPVPAPEEDEMKRRGRKKKKKLRDRSRGPSAAFHASLDPETQVAAFTGQEFVTFEQATRKNSLVVKEPIARQEEVVSCGLTSSFLGDEIVRSLRRELTEDLVEFELDLKKKRALEEALKSVVPLNNDELFLLKSSLELYSLDKELWFGLPRSFSRSNARFELPMDGRSLNSLSVVDYAREHVFISPTSKLLYSAIFKEVSCDKRLEPSSLINSLNIVMGTKLSEDLIEYFLSLVQVKNEDFLDFRTFSGIAAICERLIAPKLVRDLPNRQEDPCNKIEQADFERLSKKLEGKTVNAGLKTILESIKNL